MRRRVTLTWTRIALAVPLVIGAALFIGYTGLVSISAASGHYAPVGWFLHWTMRNAVRTQSLGIDVPEDVALDDPALVRRAAGHYATGCAPCHGAPGVPQSPVVLAMSPLPPRLSGAALEWEARELFWIVKNGIKYSGMPAWPSQERDDEVWAMVAFLNALPAMTADGYAALAHGAPGASGAARRGTRGAPPASGAVLEEMAAGPSEQRGFAAALAGCARCHGTDGLGADAPAGAFPDISGQSFAYLDATLRAYALGLRESGFMRTAAGRHSEAMRARLARHYADQPAGAGQGGRAPAEALASAPAPPRRARAGGGPAAMLPAPAVALPAPPSQAELLTIGARIATGGVPRRKIPACQSCHGGAGRLKNPHYPAIAGQPARYLRTQLELFREGTRGGTAYAHVMEAVARGLTDTQIEAVALWYAARRRTPSGRE